jgi:hypothetical protein
MQVSHLDGHASPFAVATVPPFQYKEWRKSGLARLTVGLSKGATEATPSQSCAPRSVRNYGRTTGKPVSYQFAIPPSISVTFVNPRSANVTMACPERLPLRQYTT